MKQLSMYDQEYLGAAHASSACQYLRIQPEVVPAKTPGFEPHSGNTSGTSTVGKQFAPNVTEIVLTKDKIDSIQLILPMLINLHQEQRWLAWIDPPIQLLKEWQKAHNEKALNDIMILRSNENFSVFELSKRALEAGTCHAVIAWTNSLNQDEFSKLETASSLGNSHGIILRSRSLA